MFVKQPAQITLIRWRRGEATSVCPLSGAKRKLLKSRIVRLWPKADILPWHESEDLPRIEHRREPPGSDMQRRGENGKPGKAQRTTTPKVRKASSAPNTEERYRLVVEAVAEGIYEWSTDTNHLELSSRLNEMLGFEKGELTSGSWLEHVHPDDRGRYRDTTIAYFKGVVPYFACEYRVLNKSGQWRWVSDRASSIRNADGRVLRLVGAITDVTDLKQKEAQLQEALEQQTATADALRIISRSNFELQTVFATLVESATRLCDADHAWLFQREGEHFRWRASFGHATEVHERIKDYFRTRPVLADRGSATGRAALEGKVVHIPDVLLDAEYTYGEAQKIAGYRAALGVPLLRQRDVIGVIFVAKIATQPFTDKQIELVTPFADHAVIAIENSRLFSELRASLQQQTATADVLKVISRSTFDAQKVLDTLVESAARLCEAYDAIIMLREEKSLRVRAHHGPIPMDITDWPIGCGSVNGRAFVDRASIHIHDLQAASQEFPDGSKAALRLGYRTALAVPLLRRGEAIGTLSIRRTEVKPFTDKQIALVTTFADQAVIAIENARLFEEVQARTRELSESLEQQTATSEVLKVISSSPGDLQSVFDAMLASATRICEATFGNLLLREGPAIFRSVAVHSKESYADSFRRDPVIDLRDNPGIPLDRVAQTKQVVHIADLRIDQSYIGKSKRVVTIVEAGGARTFVAVPMLKEDELIGIIAIYREEVRPFTDKQIELLQNFASQAVIAIENTRLLSELRESLQQQTATSDVLKVISGSLNDLKPVFETIGQRAEKLCDADTSVISMVDGDQIRLVSINGVSEEGVEAVRQAYPMRCDAETVIARAIRSAAICHVPDVLVDTSYQTKDAARASGFRGSLGVPMIRDGRVIGAIFVARRQPGLFADSQVQLLRTFADQAVVAVDNLRLFNDTTIQV